MLRPWLFIINPFISATKGSYRLMKQLGDFTVAALAAYAQNPANAKTTAAAIFNNLLAELTPLVDNFDNAYQQWVSQQGIQKGQTQTLTEVLDELSSTKIEDWDLAIQNVYRQKTSQYTALLPQKRKPFQSGSQQDRITAVGALSLAIGDDAALQTLKTEVDTFYDMLVVTNSRQKGSKTKKGGDSGDVKAERMLLCTGLYGVLGSLMNYYKDTPEVISNFFYMPALHAHEQTTYSHNVDISGKLLAMTKTFDAGDKIKFINRKPTVLQAALVAEKNDPMPATAVTIQANEEEIVTPEALGPVGNRYLIVQNMSDIAKGAYTIELL